MIDQIISLLYNVLFFITPLIMTKSTSELFEFNKMLFIYASTVLIAFFWFSKMIINKKIILKKTPLDVPIIIFFISQVISTVTSIDPHTSIFGYYGRFNGGLLSITCYLILYYGLVSNSINVEKILKSILASSLLVILWAIPGHFGHDLTCLVFTGQFSNACWDNSTLAFRPELRAFSTLGQPNWLGAYLAVTFFIGVYFFTRPARNATHSVAGGYLILNFTMILFTRSRSALAAVILGIILFLLYYFKVSIKKILIGSLVIAVFAMFFVHNPLVPNRLAPSPSQNVTESFDIRKIVWEGAWKLALKYPMFGTGVETFAYSYGFVRPVAHNLTSEWDYVYNKAHNEYFNYLATTGFVGLGAYLLLIGVIIWIPFFKGMTKTNNQTILVVCLLIAYLTILITNFFGFSTTTIQLFFYLIPALIFFL